MIRAVTTVALMVAIALALPADGSRAQSCPRPHPAQSSDRPPASLLETFAVLRRPQWPADLLGPKLRRGPLSMIYERHTRYLGQRVGTRFYLVPGRAAAPCSREKPQPYACLVADDGDGTTWQCTPSRYVGKAPSYGGGAEETDDGRVRFTVAGLAPDGVATVEADFADGTSRTVRARRNLFAFTVVRPGFEQPPTHLPRAVRYLDAEGRVVGEHPGVDRPAGG